MLSKASEKELLALLRQNDQRALKEIYNRFWSALFVIARDKLSPDEAKECVQDILCAIWNRRAELDIRYSLNTYLAAALKYKIITILDKRRKLRVGDIDDFPDSGGPSSLSPEAIFAEKELRDRIASSVEQLPERCRLVFKMSWEEGMKTSDIAIIMGITERGVQKHLLKAIRYIGKDLSGSVSFLLIFLLQL